MLNKWINGFKWIAMNVRFFTTGIVNECFMNNSQDLLQYHVQISVADILSLYINHTQIAKSMGPTWGPPGTCWPQMGPMLAPWTLLSWKWLVIEPQVMDSKLFVNSQIMIQYSIFQNQGTPFSSCLADATRRLVLPGVASACLALRCLAKQDEPRLMLSAGSDIWLLAQVL